MDERERASNDEGWDEPLRMIAPQAKIREPENQRRQSECLG